MNNNIHENYNIDEKIKVILRTTEKYHSSNSSKIEYLKEVLETLNEDCDKNKTGEFSSTLAKIKKEGQRAIEKRLQHLFSKIKYSSEFRKVDNEYLDLLNLQEKYIETYGIKKVIKPDLKLVEKFRKKSEKYISKRKLSCTPIDLKDEQNSTVYNQFDRGWCYAFSTADLISQHLGKNVSRVHLSLLYNKYDFLNGLENQFSPSSGLVQGGFAKSALNVAKKHGLCLEKDLPSFGANLTHPSNHEDTYYSEHELRKYLREDLKSERELKRDLQRSTSSSTFAERQKLKDETLKELYKNKINILDRSKGYVSGVHFVESLYDDFKVIQGSKLKLQFLEGILKITPHPGLKENLYHEIDNKEVERYARKNEAIEYYRDNFFTCNNGQEVGNGILGEIFPNLTLEDFIETLETSSRKDFFLNLQNKSCQEDYQLDYKIIQKIALGHNADKHLDEALEKGKLATIEYNADIFDSIVTKTPVVNFANHVSTVMARRWNESTETCEYQIKNSWGPKWNTDQPVSNMDGQGDGFVWIPEDEIKISTTAVTHIE